MVAYSGEYLPGKVSWETKSHKGCIPVRGIKRVVVGRRYPGLYDVLAILNVYGNPPVAEETVVLAALLPKKEAEDIAETIMDTRNDGARDA